MKTFPPKKSAVERVSGLLVTVDEAFIEKDWYVVQVLRLLNDMQTHNFQIAFGGGTSLAKAGIIKRFSEDVDFKVTIHPFGHKYYREARKKIIAAIVAEGFVLVADPKVYDESRFFSIEVDYGSTFAKHSRLRTHIRIEVRFGSTQLPVVVVEKSALDIKSYFTTNVVQTTRGCPFSCDFCNVHVMNGHRLRHRTIPAVLREVETFLKEDKRIFFFLDDTINADEEYAEQLFRQQEPFKIKWVGQATTALGEKPRLLDAFARSGCGALLIGIESLTDGSNHAHKKFHNPAARQVECIKHIRQAGICVYGSFIYGLDEDTLELPAKLEAFIEETSVDVPGINLLRPIPGTGVFNRLALEGRLLHSPDDHDAFKFSWGQEMLYKPLRIPLQEFIPSYTTLTSRVFTVQNAVKRAMRAPRLRSAVLMFNLLYVHMYGMARKDLLRQLGGMG